MLRLVVFGALVTMCGASGAFADDIHLLCRGTATYAEINHASAFASTNRGGFGSASAYAESRGAADGEVLVDLVGGSGRIKVPAVMVPPMHGHNDDGWWTLNDLSIGQTEINAKFDFNFVDKPTVEIDRVSGHIDIKGLNKRTFAGDCAPYDETTARKF